MQDRKLLLLLSQSFIGTGFFFLYVFHVRAIFESRTNIAHGEQLERESLLRREDALYYSFYKTLTEERDFWVGYEKLMNNTGIEYPANINVLKRFHVLPELSIGYLYHLWRYYIKNSQFPLISCWRSHDVHLPMELRDCDMSGQAMQFYLEFVWLLGGLTVLVIYLYGTLLSQNVFGGFYAVISYAMFHSCYAGKIYDRPVARENFAFPFILMQMFHLCKEMNGVGKRKAQRSRLIFVFNQTLMSTIALLCWQFSSVIFASQLLIMMTPWTLSPNTPEALYSLNIDYSISQLLANAIGYYFSFESKKYAFSWQLGPAIGLFCISLELLVKKSSEKSLSHSVKTMAIGMLLSASAQSCFIDLMEKGGIIREIDNTYALYRDLVMSWTFQAKINFTTSLAACNAAYERMVWSDLWELVKTLIVKPYCLYGVVMLAKFFRKWRKSGENKQLSEEYQERMKKYVLEDFLESNHVSMNDLSNKETEDELNECLKTLSECNYDYDKYKQEIAKRLKSNDNEHKEFMDDIRNLKKRINAINKKTKKTDDDTKTLNGKVNCPKNHNDDEEENEFHDKTENEWKNNEGSTTLKSSKGPKKDSKTKRSRNADLPNKSARSNYASQSSKKVILPDKNEFGIQYAYSFIQMVVFTIIGLTVKKLFFLSFTLGCIIAPTICSKLCFRNQRDIFWTISLTVFITSIINPGLVNLREEYYPSHSPYGNDDLDTMLQWIKMNTETNAVFAGPIDIIGTVHLATKRPIVNHAHLEIREISERTEYVYSAFSRQLSSDVYNQFTQLKVQYLIVSMKDCTNEVKNECDILSIWDDLQPAYRDYPQFCYDLIHKNIPSFLKVFSNDYFTIIKMFSQSVQISLKRNIMPARMPEKSM